MRSERTQERKMMVDSNKTRIADFFAHRIFKIHVNRLQLLITLHLAPSIISQLSINLYSAVIQISLGASQHKMKHGNH